MYEIAKLEALATDANYVEAVQSFVKRLIASGLVNSHGLTQVAPLTQYGPDCSGTALRLKFIPQFADLDGELGDEWAELAKRVEVARA